MIKKSKSGLFLLLSRIAQNLRTNLKLNMSLPLCVLPKINFVHLRKYMHYIIIQYTLVTKILHVDIHLLGIFRKINNLKKYRQLCVLSKNLKTIEVRDGHV